MSFFAEFGIEAVRFIFLVAVAVVAVVAGKKFRDYRDAKKDTEAKL